MHCASGKDSKLVELNGSKLLSKSQSDKSYVLCIVKLISYGSSQNAVKIYENIMNLFPILVSTLL